MAVNPKHTVTPGIFLLYEGLPPTIVESQVLAHARAMSAAQVPMQVWSFATSSHSYSEALSSRPRLSHDYGIMIRVFRGVRPTLPSSGWLNALILLWWMWRLNARPPFVHARTENAAAIAAIAKRFMGYRLIWDARGDTLSEHKVAARRWPSVLRLFAPLIGKIKGRRIMLAARHCDAAIFVSDALRRLQGKALPIERTMIVPCLADEALFYYSPRLRAATRAGLGYGDDTIVIAYVGSTAPWQCIPETVSLMENALLANPSVRAVIVTSNRVEFEQLFSVNLRPRILITTGSLRDVNAFLNAADYGVLLRQRNSINHVASPVKFAEYSLAGLTVVTTDAIEQVIALGQLIGNTVDVGSFRSCYTHAHGLSRDRQVIAANARRVLGRSTYIEKFAALYEDR